jgi:hypothetical protein
MLETDQAVQDAIRQVRARIESPLADLEDAIEVAIRQGADRNGGSIPQPACDQIRESLVTQFLHAGRFVVYRDQFIKTNGTTRLARLVFHVASTADEAIGFLETLPEEHRGRAEVEYQPDPYRAAV